MVQPHASGPSGPAASRHARRRPTMRDAPSGRSGGAGTAPAPPGPPPDDRPADPAAPAPPGTPGGDPGGPSRPAPRPSALDNPSYHTRGTRSEPLPEQPSQYRLPEIRPDARRITFDGAGVRVRGGCGSAVSGRGERARMCSIGRAEAVLHIRPGPAGGGSAESCGNAPTFNAVEVLPCAEGARSAHGSPPTENRHSRRTSESRGKIRTGSRGSRPPMCSAPATGPGRPGRQARAARAVTMPGAA